MKVMIQKASLADLDKLMEWRMEVLHEVFSIPQERDTQSLHQSNLEYYKEAISNGSHVAIFAVRDQKTVGCGGLCLYREMPSPDNPSGQCAYLMNVYTRKEYRGTGVGRAVVQWLARYAREKGVTKIYLETSGNGRAFYEGLGFRDMLDYMKLQ